MLRSRILQDFDVRSRLQKIFRGAPDPPYKKDFVPHGEKQGPPVAPTGKILATPLNRPYTFLQTTSHFMQKMNWENFCNIWKKCIILKWLMDI